MIKDEEKMIYLDLGYTWIIRSDKLLTTKQHNEWMDEVMKESEAMEDKKI